MEIRNQESDPLAGILAPYGSLSNLSLVTKVGTPPTKGPPIIRASIGLQAGGPPVDNIFKGPPSPSPSPR